MAIGPKGPRKHEGMERIPTREQRVHKGEVVNPFDRALDHARAAARTKAPKRDRTEGMIDAYKRFAPTLDRNEIDKMHKVRARKGDRSA